MAAGCSSTNMYIYIIVACSGPDNIASNCMRKQKSQSIVYMVDGTNEKNFLPIVHYRICAPEKFCAFKHENNVGLPFAVCPCPCSCVCVRFVVAIEQYTISYNFINSNKFMKIVTHQCTLTLGLIRPTVIIPHSPPPLNQVLGPGL